MSRQSTVHTTALLCLFAMQAWLIYRVETALAQAAGPAAEANNKHDATIPVAALSNADTTAFAAHVSARLSALENRDVTTANPVSSEDQAPIALDGASTLAADRKLEAMLPAEPMTHEEMILFQTQLAQLPAQERDQLMAALSRAINSGRVRQKLN